MSTRTVGADLVKMASDIDCLHNRSWAFSDQNNIRAFFSSSPENEVCRCIRTRVGQENAHKPPSSWETTAALLQMFVTNKAMNIFMDTRGHDRLSLIYRPFTIEEEVTFSEEEDVSAEKGRKEDARCRVCAWTEPAAEPVVVIDCYCYIKCNLH